MLSVLVRCIRHRSDFGAIVLCDPRYVSQPETTASLSKWVRSTVTQSRSVETSLPRVCAFFEHHQKCPRRERELASAAVRSIAGPTGVSGCGGGGSGGICGDGDSCEKTSDRGRIVKGKQPTENASGGSPRSRLIQQVLPQVRGLRMIGIVGGNFLRVQPVLVKGYDTSFGRRASSQFSRAKGKRHYAPPC